MRLLGLSDNRFGQQPVVRDAHIDSRIALGCFAHFRVMVRTRTTMETVCIALQALLRCPTRLREPPEGTPARVRPTPAPVTQAILQICHMERSVSCLLGRPYFERWFASSRAPFVDPGCGTDCQKSAKSKKFSHKLFKF